MGTRGLRVYRFRKRYYAFYNHYDSYPEGLGKEIVAEIPAEPSEYQVWLATKRATVAEWEAKYEAFITVVPGNKVNDPWAESKLKKSDGEADERLNDVENEEEQQGKQVPAYLEHQFPSFFTPMNDTYIEWIYTLDLDNEKFTVSNGAHFALEKMPHIDWIPALSTSSSDNQIVLPGVVPEEAVTDLVATAENHVLADMLTRQVRDLTVDESIAPSKLVTPKSIDAIPCNIRHGAVLRNMWFYLWSTSLEEVLAATLLQLTPSDLPFRELAFAVVCMAAGGKNTTVFQKGCLANNSAFGFTKYEREHENREYFNVLGSGARREGERAGSAPQETTYWFENVLIVLTAQLYRKGAVDRGIGNVAKFCQAHHPDTVIDAALLSIEHVVLIHIIPANTAQDAEIQHSALLPLFEIQEHLTMHTKDRYSESYLSQIANPDDEKFQKRQQRKKRKAMQERMIKNEGINMSWGDDKDEISDEDEQEEELLHPTKMEGSTCATFYALQHLFSSAARRRLRPNQQGRFPTEIYEHILSYVTDSATRDTCLHTSHILREICLKEYLVCEADGAWLLRTCEASESCVDAEHLPQWWVSLNMETGEETNVEFRRGGCSFLDWNKEKDWTVMVGNGYGRKSLLPEVTFEFPEYKE